MLRAFQRSQARLSLHIRPNAWMKQFSSEGMDFDQFYSVEVGSKSLVSYIDIGPTDSTIDATKAPTIVMLHGTPGSFNDFRYMVPHLQATNRVIGITLPGFNDSKVLDREHFYDLTTNVQGAALTYEALQEILGARKGSGNPKNLFVLGHSFGGHSSIHLTALDAKEQKLHVKGLALVSSAGTRPHKILTPSFNAIIWSMISSKLPLVEPAARYITRLFMLHILKFPNKGDEDYFIAGFARAATAEFAKVSEELDRLYDLPTFYAWAKDDSHIEEEVFQEVAAKSQAFGPRLVFASGGHNIQKTRAEVISEHLVEWTRNVLDGKAQKKYSATPVELP